jgi:hypothetical protein
MPLKIIPIKPDPRLPYPTITRKGPGFTGASEEYVIPAADREKVLLQLYPFVDPPKLTDVMIDVECEKHFVVKDFKVVREGGRNLLATPYYYESGGTVIDWWPVDEDE